MLKPIVTLVLVAAAFFTQSSSAQTQTTVRNDLPQPYRTTRDWGQLPPGVVWAAVTAVEPARTEIQTSGEPGSPGATTTIDPGSGITCRLVPELLPAK